MKCGMICLSHAAKLPVINRRKRSLTFYESSNISFNISYLVLTKIFVLYTLCEFLPKIYEFRATIVPLNHVEEDWINIDWRIRERIDESWLHIFYDFLSFIQYVCIILERDLWRDLLYDIGYLSIFTVLALTKVGKTKRSN